MLEQQVAFDCRSEIEELHRFFTAWFNGSSPADDATWATLENVIAPGFVLVTPYGTVLERAALLASLRPMHGHHAAEAGFAISVRDVRCRHVAADTVVVTYEEWQTLHGEEKGRISTAVFERNPAMPNRVRWLAVHECWLPESGSGA